MAAWLALMLIVAIAGREGMRAQRTPADGDALATRLRSGSGKPRSVWPDGRIFTTTGYEDWRRAGIFLLHE